MNERLDGLMRQPGTEDVSGALAAPRRPSLFAKTRNDAATQTSRAGLKAAPVRRFSWEAEQ